MIPRFFSSRRMTFARGQTEVLLISVTSKAVRIQFVSGAHRADDRRVGFFRLFHQNQLSRHGVDCVDHVVILGKIKFLRGIRHVECLVGVDNRMWVDGFDAFLSDINLVLSDGGGGCDDLAVDVGLSRPCHRR